MNTRFKDFVNEARKYKVQFPITTGVGVKYEDVNREVEIKKFAIISEIFDLDSVTGTIGKNNYELDFGKSMAGGMSVFLTTWGDRIQKKVGRNFFGDTYEAQINGIVLLS